jgi:hypothetical protein
LISDGGQAKANGSAVAGPAVNVGDLVLGASEADTESFDLAEPAFPLGFGDSGDQVVANLGKPCALRQVRSKE